MDKEKRAYEVLLQTVNTRVRDSRAADQVHYERQLKFLRDIASQTSGQPDGKASQLAELLTAAAQADDSISKNGNGSDELLYLNAWLLWLHELLHSRQQLLGDTEPLLQWLLQRVEQEAGATADALRCLLSLLEALPAPQARVHFPRLAAIPMPGNVEAALLLMLCQDQLLGTELKEEELQICSQLADTLVQSHYDGRWTRLSAGTATTKQDQLTLLVAHSLQLLQKIAAQHADYAQEHAPELLGLALAYVRSRTTTTTATTTSVLQVPHRVQPAQQSGAYGQDEEDLSSVSNNKAAAAGRRVKSRKMRSLTKQRNGNGNGHNVQDASKGATAPTGNEDRMQLLLMDYGCRLPSGDSTSDGAAGPAGLAGSKQQRQCQVKVRIAALQLLGAVTKQLPRRALYGYWHALFPSAGGGGGGVEASSGSGSRSRSEEQQHLLHIGASDGNVRCRAQALQLAAQLIYGSKPYLSQASSTLAPSNYTPFALSLASSVLEAYRQLTGILVREYAPPVLTQCLKCLAVLVQATPFDQLQMGFVYEFVPHVKKLARHMDTSVKVSALLVMEMLLATPRLTQEMACAVGLPIKERPKLPAKEEPQFQQLCDSDEDGEEEQEEEEEEEETQERKQAITEESRIPRNSWLLRLVLRYLDCPPSASPSPLRVECLQVILAMSTHFALLRNHLSRLSSVLCGALEDASHDVRLYGARCLDAVGFQIARQPVEQLNESDLNFWQRMLPAIYVAYQDAGTGTTTILKSSLCDALSNMGVHSFERLPQPQRNGLLAFLLGCSSDDAADPLVRAAALRALAVYVLHPTLRSDLVFVEHTAELALRLIGDSQLGVRIKAAWALGNISDALVGPSQTTKQEEELEREPDAERISQMLLSRLIEAAVLACSDHDKVRANAVRALGNLLRLLPADEQGLMQRATSKLLDCVRAAGSAKVKWNACYAIGSLVRNRALFASSASLAGTLYATLGQLIVQHANFKVRINATAVLLQIEHRADFGVHYATMWRSLLAAIERSNALDTFEEYNHRDGLQQQLCLAMAHMLARARPDDLLPCRAALESQLDVVSSTWRRVAYRIVPELAAPLFTCGSLLQQRLVASNNLTAEQRNALTFLADALRLES